MHFVSPISSYMKNVTLKDTLGPSQRQPFLIHPHPTRSIPAQTVHFWNSLFENCFMVIGGLKSAYFLDFCTNSQRFVVISAVLTVRVALHPRPVGSAMRTSTPTHPCDSFTLPIYLYTFHYTFRATTKLICAGLM